MQEISFVLQPLRIDKTHSNMHELALLNGHEAQVWCVAWHPAGNLLASSSADRTIRLWAKEGNSWICKSILDGEHSAPVRCVAFSPCGGMLASCSFDSQTIIYRLRELDYEPMAVVKSHDKEVKCVSWNDSGEYLATCGRDKTVCVYQMDEEDDFQCVGVSESSQEDIKCIRWQPKTQVFATTSYDNTVAFHEFDEDDVEWSLQQQFEAHESTVWSMAFDSTGRRFCTCSADKTAMVWENSAPSSEKWKCTSVIADHHDGPIYSVDWCKITGLIATACGDNAVRVFSEDQKQNFGLNAQADHAHGSDVNCVSWNPKQGYILASCGDDCNVKLWCIDSFTE